MTERFEEILMVGGKSNSLGRVNDVISAVLHDKSLLEELYACMFSEDAWVRMRAADAFEKVCREHPEWIEPYVDRLQSELSGPAQQPSIQWHLAQIYRQVPLTDRQKQHAIKWLTAVLASGDADWIVTAEVMKTLVYFTKNGDFAKDALIPLLKLQLQHRSKSVMKKADQLIDELS